MNAAGHGHTGLKTWRAAPDVSTLHAIQALGPETGLLVLLLQPIPEVLVHQPLAFKEGGDDGRVFIDLVIVAQQGQALLHAGHGPLQCGIGVEHKAIAQLAQFIGVEDGGLAANDHIHELGRLQALRQGAHFYRV